MIKSTTAIKHGYGSMPYRTVSGLSKIERDTVKNGELVYFIITKTHYMQSGYKIVTYFNGRYDSREPNTNELTEINRLENSEVK